MRSVTLADYRERMLRVLLHIQENLDRELPLEELAGVAHFSPYHFHRIFSGMTGEPVMACLRRLRLARAAHRLAYGARSVTELALEAGFESPDAFGRAFRAAYGMAPSLWRGQRRDQLPVAGPLDLLYPQSRSAGQWI